MSHGPRVLVVDHHDSYTYNLVHLVASVTGALPVVVQHDETTLEAVVAGGFTHLVLSPGPGHPAEPADFALGAGVFELDIPVLGVCLGMQAMVTGFGGTVAQADPAHGEVAQLEHDGKGLFSGLPQGFSVVRYHSLQAATLPACLEATATCADPPGARALMGVRHRQLPLEGVQFHPESILTEHGRTMVENFLEQR